HPAIEHFSRSIIHLEYQPERPRHHRLLYVQKARGQSFRSGYHPFDLYEPSRTSLEPAKEYKDRPPGIRLFPSIESQSAESRETRTHSKSSGGTKAEDGKGNDTIFLFPSTGRKENQNQGI